VPNTSYRLLTNEAETADYADDTEYYFLLTYAHLIQQSTNPLHILAWANERSKKIIARFSFFDFSGCALSPAKATFGGITLSPTIKGVELYAFWGNVVSYVEAIGIRELSIKSYPFVYSPRTASLLTQLWLKNDFQVIHSDLNYHLDLIRNFENHLHTSAKRRLKKCREAGFEFSEWTKPDLVFVHQFIAEARHRKGHLLTLNYPDFEMLFRQFPEIYQVFRVLDKEKTIALTVTVRFNERILYNFYPADAVEYQTFSPMIFLIAGTCQYAQAQGYTYLDLGIATDKGVPDFGLIRFKENLGAETSLKLSFQKRFS
jgi:hypothetical protein